MLYVSAVVLTALNLVFWVGMLFNLPGTWLMILITALLKWWQPAYVLVSWTVLGVAAGLAALGEVIEFVLGAAGSRLAGGSTRAAALEIVGSLIGGIMGTALSVPIVGTIIGACLGAFMGSLIGDLWAGRSLFPSFEAGWGAAVGGFWGRCPLLPSAASSSSFWRWLRSSDGHEPGMCARTPPPGMTRSCASMCDPAHRYAVR